MISRIGLVHRRMIRSTRIRCQRPVKFPAHLDRIIPTRMKVGGNLLIIRCLFTDPNSGSQVPDKLGLRSFGPFVITKLVEKNAFKVELPDNLKIHPVVHVLHTTPYASKNIIYITSYSEKFRSNTTA